MNPETYLSDIRKPLLLILREVAAKRKILPEDEISRNNDVRDLLKQCTAALIEKRKNLRGSSDRDSYQELQKLINVCHFMSDIFNVHAHSHLDDLRILSLAVMASTSMLKQYAGKASPEVQPAWKDTSNLETSLLEGIAPEYVRIPSKESREDDLTDQIQALHDKIDTLISQGGQPTKSPDRQTVPLHLSKRKRLEEIREEIHEFARNRGRNMKPWQHLLQHRYIDFLIDESPTSKEELLDQAKLLPSYETNKTWIDRQIERWGDRIVKAALTD